MIPNLSPLIKLSRNVSPTIYLRIKSGRVGPDFLYTLGQLPISLFHSLCGCASLSPYLLKSYKVLYNEAGRGYLRVLRTVLPLSYNDN